MDVERTARLLNIANAEVIARARQLFRMATVKVQNMGQGEVCKAAVCLELACSTMPSTESLRIEREKYIKAGCTTAKVYQSAFNLLQKVLDVRPPELTLTQLAHQHGCSNTSVVTEAEALLQRYKERYILHVQREGASSRCCLDFTRPVFTVAAFLLVARNKKVKVEQRPLMQRLNISSADLSSTCASMEELCGDLLGRKPAAAGAAGKSEKGASKGGKSGSRKRSRAEDDGGEGDGDAEEEPAAAAGSKKRRRSGGEAAAGSKSKSAAGRSSKRRAAAEGEDDEEEGFAGGEEEEAPKRRQRQQPCRQTSKAAGRRAASSARSDEDEDEDDGLGSDGDYEGGAGGLDAEVWVRVGDGAGIKNKRSRARA